MPRQHGSIRVRLQEQFDPAKVTALKRFHLDFFDKVNEGNDPRSVAQITSETLAGEVGKLQDLLDQAGRYPFLNQLKIPLENVKTVADKDYTYLLNHLADFSDELMDAKDDLLAPIKAFMHGPQRQTYDEVIAFYRRRKPISVKSPRLSWSLCGSLPRQWRLSAERCSPTPRQPSPKSVA
jgi:hypothetical protein